MEGITLDSLPDPERPATSAGHIDQLFERALADFGPAISRIARANEANPARRADLHQEIYFELWRSLAGFDGGCALGTWVYRVALLNELIGRLKPLDRHVMLLYLDDLDAAQIGEVTGLSASHVTVKVHRVKRLLARMYAGTDHE